MTAPPDDLVAVGAIARPHGVRGELRVHRFNPDSELLLHVDAIWVRRPEGLARFAIETARRHKGFVLVTLEGVRGREAAEALKGGEVLLPRSAFPPADEDEYYHVDLIGLRAEREDGSDVGEVAEVIHYPSVDCLRLRTEEGDREVPIVEPYVVEIDPEAGRVVVAHVEDFELQRRRPR